MTLEALAATALRSEPRLVGAGLTDPRSMLEVIWPAFQREVAPWAQLDYTQEVVPRRVLDRLRQSPPGAQAPDVLIVGNPAAFVRAGLVDPLECPNADAYPAGWTDPGGRWIPLYVQPVVAIYNQLRLPAPPARWSELATGPGAGRFVCEEPSRMISTGPAFSELVPALGEEVMTRLMEGIAAREPLLVGDNERSVLEVATGSRWLGLSIWNVARRVRVGSPVRHVFLQPTPCVPGFGLLARAGANPGLARLFLAWLASSGGQRAYEATGRIPALPDLDVPTTLARVLPTGIRPVFGAGQWLSEPERWAGRLERVFSQRAGSSLAPAGKLGT